MKIYILIGNTGSYDDYIEWVVKAFRYERVAKEYMEKAKKHVDKMVEQDKKKEMCTYESSRIPKEFKIFDENLRIDGEVNYRLERVELIV